MTFIRDALPNPVPYFEGQGLILEGKGTWRTTRCDFHGGSDSLRVNTLTGGFVCMAACGARGGDVLDYHRAAHGLGFVEAAKALGAWVEDGTPNTGSTRPTAIPARALLQLAAHELTICVVVLADALAARMKDADYQRLCAAVGRVTFICGVANGRL
jgi:hypothetical protein